MGLCSCLMLTLPALVFDSFMCCLLVLSKTPVFCKFLVAFPAYVFDSLMCNFFVSCQTFLLYYLVATDITTIIFIFTMDGSCVNDIDFVRCDLIITFVTRKHVHGINAANGLMICDTQSNYNNENSDQSQIMYIP